MLLTRRSALGALTAVSMAALTACGRDAGPASGAAGSGGLSGAIKGAGASSQADAQAVWMNAFMDANPHAVVDYAGGGSGAGRTKLIEGAVDYAGSDSPMGDDELAKATDVIELPLYISPIAITYNLPALTGQQVQMSAETVAKVFSGQITRWDDAALAADNPGVELPDLGIIVVHRSDDSGTTKNLTDYLNRAAPRTWTWEAAETWPADLSASQSGDGTSGIITTIEAAQGAIGYADASKVTDKLGTVAVGSGGQYIPCSAQAAAAALDASGPAVDASSTRVVYDIARDAPGTYPIILVSYLLARQNYDDADIAATVKGYLTYIASVEGQQAAARAAGSAPISQDLRTRVTAAIDTIKA